jgi:Holliday junction resolvase RusA-like endonuclease
MIHFKLEGLPLSVNHAYFQKGKQRILTKKGRAYKTEVKTTLAQQYPQVLSFFQPDKPYCIIFRFTLKHTTNTTAKAKTRYKRVDVSNRIKLLEDALTDACGHDDAQHFRVLAWKEQAGPDEPEHVDVWAWSWEDEPCPFDDILGETLARTGP